MPETNETTFCAYYNQAQCRSCGWLALDYAAQLASKEALVRERLDFFKTAWQLAPSVRSETQGFRNRAKMVVTGSCDQPLIGLSGDAQNLDSGQALLACPIHHPKLNELMAALPAWITEFKLTPYRIKARLGELKGIIAFYSPLSRQMYVRFVVRSHESVDRLKAMLPRLQARFPEAVCVTANIQPVPHAILEGKEEVFLTARRFIDHELGHDLGAVLLRLAPQAFVQTNAKVATALYAQAARWIKQAQPARVLELFSGQGAFSFFAAGSAPSLFGVELNEDAVRAANATAVDLGLSHLSFKAADATQISAEIEAYGPELILANPPRRGLTPAGVAMIKQAQPRHFIYSSCNVQSLALDLAELSKDFRIANAQIFDMFPHTEHFETLVWLEKI